MNAKRKGTRNEHKTMRLLESLGEWDVVGIGSVDMVLVQVKSRDYPGATEMETLKSFPSPPNCRKLIHRWRDGQQLPDVREILP